MSLDPLQFDALMQGLQALRDSFGVVHQTMWIGIGVMTCLLVKDLLDFLGGGRR